MKILKFSIGSIFVKNLKIIHPNKTETKSPDMVPNNNVKNFYKRRNSIIHEGELHIVNLLDVKMLRSYCRRVILKRISDQMEKSDMVEALKERSECVEWKNVNSVLFQDLEA